MNVYVDTGGWVAYFDQSDRFHALVTSYVQATVLQAVDRLVTSDYVLDETVSYLRYHISHAIALTALRTLSALAQAHHMTILEVNREIRRALATFSSNFTIRHSRLPIAPVLLSVRRIISSMR